MIGNILHTNIMKKRTKKSAKHDSQHNPLLAFVIAGFLMLALGIAGDALFADYHVAVYGGMPTDGYTPVQKSSVSSKSNTAARRASARRSAAPAASSTSSSSLSASAFVDFFPTIDASTCVDGNPGGCTKLIRALADDANPACLRVPACKTIVETAGKTPECRKNDVCFSAYLTSQIFSVLTDCVKTPVSCKNVFPAIKADVVEQVRRSHR